jgi:hypothetical protein
MTIPRLLIQTTLVENLHPEPTPCSYAEILTTLGTELVG